MNLTLKAGQMRYRTLALVLAAGGLTSTNAFASCTQAVSTVTCSYELDHVTVLDSRPYYETVLVPGFDASLGTLEGVTLSLSSTTQADVVIINTKSPLVGDYYNATASVPLTVSSPWDTVATTTNAGPYAGTTTKHVTVIPGLPAQTIKSSTVVPSFNLSHYETPLTLSFSVTFGDGTYGGQSHSTNQISFGGQADTSGTFTVTYAYAAPEPSTWALIAIGFVGLATVSQRSARARSRRSRIDRGELP